MRQILPYPIWLGNAGDGQDPKAILDAGIQAVVQLAAEEPPLQLPRDLMFCRFPLVDGPGNDAKLVILAVTAVGNFLEKRVPMLVCCGMGMSRSPAVAAIALAMVYQQSPEECLQRIAEHAPSDVAPGFWNEVRGYFELDGRLG